MGTKKTVNFIEAATGTKRYRKVGRVLWCSPFGGGPLAGKHVTKDYIKAEFELEELTATITEEEFELSFNRALGRLDPEDISGVPFQAVLQGILFKTDSSDNSESFSL